MRSWRLIERASALIGRTLDHAKFFPLSSLVVLVGYSGALVLLGVLLPAGAIRDRIVAELEGVRPAGVRDLQQFQWTAVRTVLHDLEMLRVPIGTFGGGGAIEQVGHDIIFATPTGFIGYLTSANELRYTSLRVPMKFDELIESEVFNLPTFTREWFRVLDLLVVERGAQSYDLYVSHHRFMEDCVSMVLSKITVRSEGGELSATSDDWKTIYSAQPCIPFYYEGIEVFSGQVGGGRLQQLNDRELLMTTGDHAFDGVHTPGEAYAQSPRNDLGKVLKIDVDTGSAVVLASGMRNPQGLLVTADGKIWETEHGPRGGDELNLIVAGANYGWPLVTLGTTYEGTHWPANPYPGRHWNYTRPVFAFVPSIGISNLVEVGASQFPHWDGDLLISSIVSRRLYRIRRDGDTVQYAEPISIGEKIRDVLVRHDGQIVALSDDGFLVFIRNAEISHDPGPAEVSGLALLPVMEAETFKGWRNADTPVGRGHVTFARSCQSCHVVAESNGVGPHLKGLAGRTVGSVEGFPYSAALSEISDRWSARLLRAYLDDPQATFPGTAMADPGLTPAQADDIVAYLLSLQ
jgi:cytochrome c2